MLDIVYLTKLIHCIRKGMLTQHVFILVQGKWIGSSGWNTIVDPLNGEPFIRVAEIDETEIQVLLLMTAYFFKNLLSFTWWIAFAAICEESDQMPKAWLTQSFQIA